eukprot:gene26708-32811_t
MAMRAHQDTLPIVDALRARGWNAEVIFYTPGIKAAIFKHIVETADAFIQRVAPGTLGADEEEYLSMLHDLIAKGLVALPHPDTSKKFSAMKDSPSYPAEEVGGDCSVLMVGRVPVGVRCGSAISWEPPTKYKSFLYKFCPTLDSLLHALGVTSAPLVFTASFKVSGGTATLCAMECVSAGFPEDLEIAEKVATEVLCMVAEAKLLKKSVVIFEVAGGSDKDAAGFRKDTLPLCDMLSEVQGWHAEVIFYSDAQKDKICEHVLANADAYVHRIAPENLPDNKGYLEMLKTLQDGGVFGLPNADSLTQFCSVDKSKIDGDMRVLMAGEIPYCMMTADSPSKMIHPSKCMDLAKVVRETEVAKYFDPSASSRPSVWTLDYKKTADG